MLELNQLRSAIKYEGGISRRLFLAYTSALSSVPLLGLSASADDSPKFDENPFTLGVASGDPDHKSVVLWTRLAPKPLQPGGGMPRKNVAVYWELATDDKFKSVVASGVTKATPQLGHSVHVEVDGLRPDHWYWYRFRAGEAESTIGRTRTLPSPEILPSKFRFAVTSCQNYEQGLFTPMNRCLETKSTLLFILATTSTSMPQVATAKCELITEARFSRWMITVRDTPNTDRIHF